MGDKLHEAKMIMIGDMKNGYSFVDREKFEEMQIEKELNENKNNDKHEFVNKITPTLNSFMARMYFPSSKVYDIVNIPEIEKVIFNNPATIVMWSDRTKTVVKCENDSFDEEKGLAMAISKKVLGNKGNYYNEFKRWLPEKEEFDDRVSIDEMTARFYKFGEKLGNFKGDE